MYINLLCTLFLYHGQCLKLLQLVSYVPVIVVFLTSYLIYFFESAYYHTSTTNTSYIAMYSGLLAAKLLLTIPKRYNNKI